MRPRCTASASQSCGASLASARDDELDLEALERRGVVGRVHERLLPRRAHLGARGRRAPRAGAPSRRGARPCAPRSSPPRARARGAGASRPAPRARACLPPEHRVRGGRRGVDLERRLGVHRRARVVAEDRLARDGELHVRAREADLVVGPLQRRDARVEQVDERPRLRHVGRQAHRRRLGPARRRGGPAAAAGPCEAAGEGPWRRCLPPMRWGTGDGSVGNAPEERGASEICVGPSSNGVGMCRAREGMRRAHARRAALLAEGPCPRRGLQRLHLGVDVPALIGLRQEAVDGAHVVEVLLDLGLVEHAAGERLRLAPRALLRHAVHGSGSGDRGGRAIGTMRECARTRASRSSRSPRPRPRRSCTLLVQFHDARGRRVRRRLLRARTPRRRRRTSFRRPTRRPRRRAGRGRERRAATGDGGGGDAGPTTTRRAATSRAATTARPTASTATPDRTSDLVQCDGRRHRQGHLVRRRLPAAPRAVPRRVQPVPGSRRRSLLRARPRGVPGDQRGLPHPVPERQRRPERRVRPRLQVERDGLVLLSMRSRPVVEATGQ